MELWVMKKTYWPLGVVEFKYRGCFLNDQKEMNVDWPMEEL